ncbi:PREDICTED: sulfhydryl oxidase 2-like isoform X1 [Ipomoea nil]|uniref:sulfhydryl oxidase 2-like isoform X1 n=1 Tax=Ipomoea nil TaxID=35883 RepID=UPI000901D04A|nr:PREDICTED: sulfhydryl oxidase 2-like isoform X1 [Ipomoea nil]
MSSSVLILCWAMFVWSLGASVFASAGSHRSLLRAISDASGGGGGVDEKRDYAVDLNATGFDVVLKDTPATYAIVEFFANWCPACRNYKPQYEKVARLFNGADAIHPGLVLMTRVDCALGLNSNLCDKFSVGHYPMLFWGPPKKFVGGSWNPNQEKGDIITIDNGRTATLLLDWINKQLGSSYGLDDEKYENEHIQTSTADLEQIARAIYDVEEATSTAFDIILGHKMIKSETKASLITFLQLLVAHHPSRRCRKGSGEILVNFDDICSSEALSKNKDETVSCTKKGVLGQYQICGKEVPRGNWMFCHGSTNDTRGFSCGLWVLLHSLSVRVEDGESEMAFKATCDFIHNFFLCDECREHFHEMCSSVSSPLKTARDYVLWLWNAHNNVNDRLMKQEASLGTGDPKFPKIIWPPKHLCPSCYLRQSKNGDGNNKIKWDDNEVFKFLVSYYGKTLTLHKDKELLVGDGDKATSEDSIASANVVAVPVGAAFAIGVASCTFGALACFWRSRQKIRKTKESWKDYNRANTLAVK